MKNLVQGINQKIFFCCLNHVDTLDIEYGLYGYNYFYLISAPSFNDLLNKSIFNNLPVETLSMYKQFWGKYQNQILFSVEYKKDLEILLGFESAGETFTVVLDKNGVVVNIKYYTALVPPNALGTYNYKLKFDTGEELYFNTTSMHFPWFSICKNSVYSHIHKGSLNYKNIKLISKFLKEEYAVRKNNNGWSEMHRSTFDKRASFLKM